MKIMNRDELHKEIADIKDIAVKAQKLSERLNLSIEWQSEMLKRIFDLLPAMVFYKDLTGKITCANKAFYNTTGLDRNVIENNSPEHWNLQGIPGEQLKKHYANDLDVINNGKFKTIIEPLLTDPNRIFKTEKMPYYENGVIAGVIGFSYEITEIIKGNNYA